ncbi:JmjC domain-containing protein [Variovorax sp. LjRoot178]|uniref:JmjC domain-containing protein n=1 Tax=Variovorax sp. LjRoot178 TaxID=3342277 RepID=UPI003ECC7935
MNNSNSSLSGEQTKSCRVWTDDSDRFSVNKIAALRHNFHEHPLFQVAELAQLAKELVPFKKCRFIRPGISQASSFTHDSEHPDGRGIDEVFRHIEEPGSWVALYNIEVIPRYADLLASIVDTMRPYVEREQPGIFNVNGFAFISAPPSVTPFHIDRENNFWLQLHGRKTMNVWDHTDRVVVSAEAVEDFIVGHSLRKVRFKEEFRQRSHQFETQPGDGVYFPSTSPHMTSSGPGWARPGDGVSISIGVTFYTSVTRRMACVHQVNRLMRKMQMSPAFPGESAAADALKAPVGMFVGMARSSLSRMIAPLRGVKLQAKAPPGSF